MTLAATEALNVQPTNAERVAPVSLTSTWTWAISSNQDTRDAATITNPTTEITAATRRILTAEGRQGTHLVPRVKWDATQSHTTTPVFAAFGHTGSDAWVRLRTRSGSLTWTPTFTNYTADGTYRYTVPNLDTDPFDRMGCEEVIFGTETAAVLDPVEGLGSILEVKPI